MATESQQIAQRIPGEKSSLPTLALIAGWLIPGAGHLVVRKPIRAALLFVSILGMFVVGLSLQGKVYSFGTDSIIDKLCFVAQLGLGVLFGIAKGAGWGASSAVNTMADYGGKFLIAGGLLNVIAAVDALSLANGRKAS
ncbi:DUF6677 family protein [Granulicella cerasi]|uniref:DUF6677 family protein n=1 Tax=Granulicella cerasi TaxID=741063 RepID=A0ABW1ZCH9_9BACT|nr:DUF6677 family protein [Granulicella cerasi]